MQLVSMSKVAHHLNDFHVNCEAQYFLFPT